MSFIFAMRSAQNNSTLRRDPASVTSLQRIEEDNPTSYEPPPVPPRNRNRPNKEVPLNSQRSPPPSYSDVGRVPNTNEAKLVDIRRGVRNNKQVAKRGGWARACLIALVAILCIVGLAVGLVFGLRKHKSSSHSSNSSSTGGESGTTPNSGNPQNSTVFPAGSYSFETYLSTVASNCTSNSATWTCYPYFTYSQSPFQSSATFEWIIEPVGNSKNYIISSSANPFSITFANVSLTFNQTGQPDEHYFFQTFVDKVTIPTTQLGSQNVVATCHFNQTTFQGYLYTKMLKTFPDNSTATNTSITFGPWPYAVKIEQIASSGTSEPTCLGPSGQSLGDFSVPTRGELCDCLYTNTGT